jgi:DHA1 family bicyclomycin/chloramphenicol resistance-like MFS transporter
VGSVVLAIPIGLAFDGTPVPGVLGVLVLAGTALAIMRRLGARGEAPG